MKGNPVGRFVRITLGRVVPLFFRTKVTGIENIPATGALLAGNHVSYMDPVLLWCVTPRPIHFMSKSELWENRLVRWALLRLWSFPVNRGEPDRTAITTATELLRSGALVGVFPEGSRAAEASGELGQAHGGAAFIALRAEAPIVPVAFAGTEKIWPRGQRFPKLARAYIRIGAPIYTATIAPEAGRKERVAAVTEETMRRIVEELETLRRDLS